MSDALNYLINARPEAMKPYFKFIKEAGRHLDPKTRSLISVITKVDAQSESGFRQYLPRALRDGATAYEVLDALLMAFPVLGLTKTLWAIDILLDMDIPEFRLNMLDQQPQWHVLGPLNDYELGEVSCKEIDDRHVFVYRSEQKMVVYDSRCPHQVTQIPDLALEGLELTCPKHSWKFDVTTGECIAIGKRPLRKFESKIENGCVLAFW